MGQINLQPTFSGLKLPAAKTGWYASIKFYGTAFPVNRNTWYPSKKLRDKLNFGTLLPVPVQFVGKVSSDSKFLFDFCLCEVC